MARKGIVCESYRDLLMKCKEKFEINKEMTVSLVLKDDGVEVDASFFRTLEANTKVVVLKEGECWTPRRSKQQWYRTRLWSRFMTALEEFRNKTKKRTQDRSAIPQTVTTFDSSDSSDFELPDVHSALSGFQLQERGSPVLNVLANTQSTSTGQQFTQSGFQNISVQEPAVTFPAVPDSQQNFQTPDASFRQADTPTISFRLPENENTCSVCYDRPKDCVLFPCRHPFCTVCATHFAENKKPCPLCRKPVLRACSVNI